MSGYSMKTPCPRASQHPARITWGFAGPWYGQLAEIPAGADQLPYHIAFARQHGLDLVSAGLADLRRRKPADLERLAEDLDRFGLVIAPYVGFDYLALSAAEAAREAAKIGQFLTDHARLFRGMIAKTSAHAGHRFDRVASWPEKRARLARTIAPLAEACWQAGVPLAIENHGDYYCSDLVGLCERVSCLHLFLDTGNTFLIGERPDLAISVAAPWTIGTHFKDHRVRPRLDTVPLGFEIDGAPLGEGDVPLRECYALLRRDAPWPDRLVMEIEMISPADMDPRTCLERSLAFVRSLEKEAA
jgi:sugar phosphate isomerase/epimerase